jgi:hypothetical protein
MRMSRSYRTGAPRLRVLLSVLVAMLFLQACAQDAANSTDDPPTAAEDPSAVAGSGINSEASTGEGSEASGEGDAQAGAGDEVASVDLDGDFCAIVDWLNDSGILTAQIETTEELTTTAEQVEQAYGAMTDKAPGKIAEDMRIVADAGTEQIQIVVDAATSGANEDVDMDTLLEQPEVAQQLKQIDSNGKIKKARRRVGKWSKKNC